jgi:hypothetical protein
VNKKRSGIREKILKPVTLIGLTSIIFFALFAFGIIKNQVEISVKRQTHSILDTFANSIQDDILNGLDTEVYRKCVSIFENTFVSKIEVYGLDRIFCNFKNGY